MFRRTQTRRPIDEVIDEVRRISKRSTLIFFVDDNITSNPDDAKALFRALIPLHLRWVSQASIDVAHDEEMLDLLGRSGCQGVLIGFESLHADNLGAMQKRFNLMNGGFERALARLAQHGIRVYGTFIFGYDQDTPETFGRTVDFAISHGLYIAAFNHLTPFPATPLYQKLEVEDRLLHDTWWLDDAYRYNQVPFRPKRMSPESVQRACLEARRRFYGWPSILRRCRHRPNRKNAFMFRNYFLINALHRADVSGRDGFPLGDEAWTGPLLKAG